MDHVRKSACSRLLMLMAQAPHVPTDETRAEVRALASFGVEQQEIAGYVGIDAKTLRKYYRDELDRSKLRIHAKVAQFLTNAATGDALTQNTGATYSDCLRAAMFYGKTRMGLAEAKAEQEEEPPQKPIIINITRPDA